MLRIILIFSLLILSLNAKVTVNQLKSEPRFALAIVNTHYNSKPLTNNANSGLAFKKFLLQHRFKTTYIQDATRSELVKKIRDFTNSIKKNSVVLIYYNGLAYQFRDKNYLVFSDTVIKSEYELPNKGLELSKIITKINQKNARISLLVLDNQKGTRYNSFKPSKSGLSKLKVPQKWALYLNARPNHINTKNDLSRDFITSYSKENISLQHGKNKLPYVLLPKSEPFYFIPPLSLSNLDEKAYQNALKTGSVVALQNFINTYPKSLYQARAKQKLQKLYQQQERLKQQALAKKKADALQEKKRRDQERVAALEQKRLDALSALKKKGIRVYEPEMVTIPSGSYLMGGDTADNRPIHKVTISKLKVGKYEVTNKEYNQYLKSINKVITPPQHFTDKDQPAINISWYAARNYAKWLRKYTGKHYRLPTEAEWEYFARAGEKGAYIWGDEVVEAVKYAWMKRSSGGFTHEFGLRRSNNWGLFDIFGNVSEWCEDSYKSGYFHVKSDGTAFSDDAVDEKVFRGGNWKSDVSQLTSAYRFHNVPDYYDTTTGFRLVLQE
ncbi:MAG TPA: hypothetical protein ENK65_03230 [Helicobacteraceae bacterium]|nr:hypothetical protein [Helicobacteraceae bacterium]